jgi:hypothetical protein
VIHSEFPQNDHTGFRPCTLCHIVCRGPQHRREMDGSWQKRNFQKANTTPLIEIRNSAMRWPNYTHTHTHTHARARAALGTSYLLRVLRRNRASVEQLEIKRREKRCVDCYALPYRPVFSITIEPPNYLPPFLLPTLLCKLLLPLTHRYCILTHDGCNGVSYVKRRRTFMYARI